MAPKGENRNKKRPLQDGDGWGGPGGMMGPMPGMGMGMSPPGMGMGLGMGMGMGMMPPGGMGMMPPPNGMGMGPPGAMMMGPQAALLGMGPAGGMMMGPMAAMGPGAGMLPGGIGMGRGMGGMGAMPGMGMGMSAGMGGGMGNGMGGGGMLAGATPPEGKRRRKGDGASGDGLGASLGGLADVPLGMGPLAMSGQGLMGGIRGKSASGAGTFKPTPPPVPPPRPPGPPGVGAGGGFMPRPPALMDRAGFASGRVAGGARPEDGMRHGGGLDVSPKSPFVPSADPEILRQIQNATMSQTILLLWATKNQFWVESHLSTGLLRLSQLAEEEGEYAKQQVRQSIELKQMMAAALQHMESMQPSDRSKISRAMGRLEWAEADFCQKLWKTTSKTLALHRPIALAGIMVGLSQVGFKPPQPFMDAVQAYIIQNAPDLSPKDVKDFLTSFAALETPPDEAMLNAALSRIPAQLNETLPKDLAALLQALLAVEFMPSEQFMLICAQSMIHRLQSHNSLMDLGTTSELMLTLINLKFKPGPDLMSLVVMRCADQVSKGSMSAVSNLLVVLAEAYYHPGQPFLASVAKRLEAECTHLPLPNLPTSLWSFATFSYIPGQSLLRKYSGIIETSLNSFTTLQLCILLWCYALFRVCTQGVWNTLVSRLEVYTVDSINEEGLKFFYQVYLLIKAVTKIMDAHKVPADLVWAGAQKWRAAVTEETQQPVSPLVLDVCRILTGMGLHHQQRCTVAEGLFAVDVYLPVHDVAILCLGPEKFTVNVVQPQNSVQPLGHTIMQQNLLSAYKVDFFNVAAHTWNPLPLNANGDAEKATFIKNSLQKIMDRRQLTRAM